MDKRELPGLNKLVDLFGPAFSARIAFAVMVFAMLLAITSLGENNAARKMLFAQQQAADQRAVYQSKVIGEHLYKTNGLRMEAELLERGPSMKPNIRKLFGAMLKDMKAEEARYRDEKKKNEADAVNLEAERDRYRSRVPSFDYAEVLLQISIVMASISILAASLRLFYFSIGSTALGVLFMLNGYFLVFKLPLFR